MIYFSAEGIMSRTERYESRKAKLNPEYEQYTLGLALFDIVPVLLFLMSGVILWTMYDKPLFMAGIITSFIGGMCKVVWKLIIVLSKSDRRALNRAFNIMLPGGFILMLLSVLIDISRDAIAGAPLGEGSTLSALWHGFTIMPAPFLFIAGFAGLCLMAYLGVNMDESRRANWIEEIVNALSQAAILAAVIIIYLGTFYHAADTAAASMEGTDQVQVSGISVQADTDDEEDSEEISSGQNGSDEEDEAIEEGNVYFFDGPGTDTALVFYPGAKVEVSSYAPLMTALSNRGIDCYLCQMPENLALLDKDLAEDVRAANRYDNWYIGGHSLGGVAAAMYISEVEKGEYENGDSWDGMVLLASYPTEKLSTPVLSIYGTEDKVLNRDSYLKAQTDGLWPEDFTELIIEGGNHAQFGDYGHQKDDGTATITPAEQLEQTVNAVCEWISDH